MAENLLENGVDELFVEKPSWTSNTVTIGVEIPNFQKKMEEQKIVDSPRFKLSGLEFNIQVKAGTEKDPEFIGVFLQNDSKEAQTTSVTFLVSGEEDRWEMKEIRANGGWGYPKFLSHEKFQAWAKKYGDVFKLKATVTLHNNWIRYWNSFLFLGLGVPIFVQEPFQAEAA